jgi:hypothetical protein
MHHSSLSKLEKHFNIDNIKKGAEIEKMHFINKLFESH